MVQHQRQRALSFQTLPSARTLLELENVLLSVFSRKHWMCPGVASAEMLLSIQISKTNKNIITRGTCIWGFDRFQGSRQKWRGHWASEFDLSEQGAGYAL